jgi:ankyrin repeat protein
MENEKDELSALSYQEVLQLLKDPEDEFRRKIKKHKIDFDAVDSEKGKTLLISLTDNNSTDIMWVLLEYFADPNIKDKEMERTALHYACKNAFKGMILALLIFGSQTDIIDKDEKQPFELCSFGEELQKISEKINKLRPFFIQLGRKRRKNLKQIFESIDLGTKTIDEARLAG